MNIPVTSASNVLSDTEQSVISSMGLTSARLSGVLSSRSSSSVWLRPLFSASRIVCNTASPLCASPTIACCQAKMTKLSLVTLILQSVLPQEFQKDQFSPSDELHDVFYVDSRKATEKRCFWTALVHDTHRKRGVGPDCVHDSWVDFSHIQRSFR